MHARNSQRRSSSRRNVPDYSPASGQSVLAGIAALVATPTSCLAASSHGSFSGIGPCSGFQAEEANLVVGTEVEAALPAALEVSGVAVFLPTTIGLELQRRSSCNSCWPQAHSRACSTAAAIANRIPIQRPELSREYPCSARDHECAG